MLQRSRGNKYCRFGHRGKLREGDLEENNNSSLPLLRLPPFHTIFQLEKKVRLDAAQTEAAWKGAGKEVGLHVWRVEQFKIKAWPKQQYGTFYS